MKMIHLILLFIILILVSPLAVSIKTRDIFTELKTNDPDTKTAEFTLDNPSTDLTIDKLSFEFNEVCGKVLDYEVLLWQLCPRRNNTRVYSTKRICTSRLDNKTLKQVNSCYDKTIFEGYDHSIYYVWDYCPAEYIGAGPVDYNFKVTNVNWDYCGYGWGYNYDWIPIFDLEGQAYKMVAWAWVNSTWTHRYEINISEPISIARIDEPIKLDISSINCSFNDKKDARVFQDDTLEIPSVILDDNVTLVFTANVTADFDENWGYLYCNNSAVGEGVYPNGLTITGTDPYTIGINKLDTNIIIKEGSVDEFTMLQGYNISTAIGYGVWRGGGGGPWGMGEYATGTCVIKENTTTYIKLLCNATQGTPDNSIELEFYRNNLMFKYTPLQTDILYSIFNQHGGPTTVTPTGPVVMKHFAGPIIIGNYTTTSTQLIGRDGIYVVAPNTAFGFGAVWNKSYMNIGANSNYSRIEMADDTGFFCFGANSNDCGTNIGYNLTRLGATEAYSWWGFMEYDDLKLADNHDIKESPVSLVIGLEETEEVAAVVALDILFKNDTGDYKASFLESEGFRGFINLTLNGDSINTSNCTLSYEDGIIETEFSNQNFSLCGSGCDWEKLIWNLTDISNTSVIGDEIRVSACIYSLGVKSITMNTTCSGGSFLVEGNGTESPLCENGLANFAFNITQCLDDTDIQIELLDSDTNNLRYQILNLEYDREFNPLMFNTTFNASLALYENSEVEYYKHGSKNITARCVDITPTNNKNETEQITIVNIAPQIFHTFIDLDTTILAFEDNILLNMSNFSSISFFTSVLDDDIDTSIHTIYNINGTNIWNDTHGGGADNHTFDGTTFTEGIYNFTTIANDTLNATTTLTTILNITKYQDPPSIDFINISPNPAFIGDNLNCSATATDKLNTSLLIEFEWFKDDVLNASYSTNVSTTNNTLTYSDVLVNNTEVIDWTCRVRAFNGNVYSDYTNLTRSVINLYAHNITCFYDPRPYIKFTKDINWLCLIENPNIDDNPTTPIINCDYSPDPYIKLINKIDWVCSINATG